MWCSVHDGNVTWRYWFSRTFAQNKVWYRNSNPVSSTSSISSFCNWNNLMDTRGYQPSERENVLTWFDQRMPQRDDYHIDYPLSMARYLTKSTVHECHPGRRNRHEPLMFRKSIEAYSWMPIPVRMNRKDESLSYPEHVTNYHRKVSAFMPAVRSPSNLSALPFEIYHTHIHDRSDVRIGFHQFDVTSILSFREELKQADGSNEDIDNDVPLTRINWLSPKRDPMKATLLSR